MININQADFVKKAQENKLQILDVRTPNECAAGMIHKAKTINFMDQQLFLEEIEKLDKTQEYLVYCRSGNRSSKACAMMDTMGFSQTYNLIGGTLGWEGDLAI